ncbi:unnamed protein product [Symbiodinium natans]|uniref:Uncharacterized protein n=1 Tax=Symbiodinium natans TaxID=878477 RepID=A0A812NNQ2_9DINO|nr:unnamed protein product [Symbiodinium natans]
MEENLSLLLLGEPHIAHALCSLSLKNIFAVRCCHRSLNQLVCGGPACAGSKLLLHHSSLGSYLGRIDSDPGFLTSWLAANLLQWARMDQIPVMQNVNLQTRQGDAGPTSISRRFVQLNSELARMLAFASLKQTRFSGTAAEHAALHELVVQLPQTVSWNDCRYYDASATTRERKGGGGRCKAEHHWICQKYGVALTIKTKMGDLIVNFVASHELTEVVEERMVYCLLTLPGLDEDECEVPLFRSSSERWIEEKNFSRACPVLNTEALSQLQNLLCDGLCSNSLVLGILFRLLSAPVAAWDMDNFRALEGGNVDKGLGRVNFEDRPTLLWLREEFGIFADSVSGNKSPAASLGVCPLDEPQTLQALTRFLCTTA